MSAGPTANACLAFCFSLLLLGTAPRQEPTFGRLRFARRCGGCARYRHCGDDPGFFFCSFLGRMVTNLIDIEMKYVTISAESTDHHVIARRPSGRRGNLLAAFTDLYGRNRPCTGRLPQPFGLRNDMVVGSYCTECTFCAIVSN